MVFIALYRLDVQGLDRVPQQGPVLLVANHGSFLDPPIIGSLVRPRPICFLARASLFVGPLGWAIRKLNSIPLADNSGDIAAIRTVIGLLKDGHAVLIFPEGSRSEDGRMQAFRDGALLIVRRARCPVVPIAIEGAHDAWPRSAPRPRLRGCRLSVRFGEPIPPEEVIADAGGGLLERRIDAMRLDLRAAMRRRTHGRYPPPGPGDLPVAQATR
jgi:1-acyl-sn-glycerol-3-phosphate acyltransferase